MDKNEKQKIKDILQNCHINFLFGAGVSTPYLPLLNDIEERLTATQDQDEKRCIKKEYFTNVIAPNLNIINNTIKPEKGDDWDNTINGYDQFFKTIAYILLNRKSSLLSKQVNVFTTNIDILMEWALEKNGLEYNDGFSGRFNAKLSLSNFKKSTYKHSLHFDNISEIPVFNIIKMHGSLNWRKQEDIILFSQLDHFSSDLASKSKSKFDAEYNSIAIVNPERKKLEETVIDVTYYELLRMFSSELEKECTVLFVVGFSMADEHIREIIKRVADSNPTLQILVFSHSREEVVSYNHLLNPNERRYSNIHILIPPDDKKENKYTLKKVSDLFEKIILDSKESVYQDHEEDER